MEEIKPVQPLKEKPKRKYRAYRKRNDKRIKFCKKSKPISIRLSQPNLKFLQTKPNKSKFIDDLITPLRVEHNRYQMNLQEIREDYGFKPLQYKK